MNSGNVEPTSLEIAADADVSKLKEYSLEAAEGSEVAFNLLQGNQRVLGLCPTRFAVCPTGQHGGGCTHLVNC